MFGWWCSSSIATTNYPDSWFANSGFVQVNGMNCTLLKPERCLYAMEGNGVTFAFCFELIDPVFFLQQQNLQWVSANNRQYSNDCNLLLPIDKPSRRRVWVVVSDDSSFFCTISRAISSPIHSEWVFGCVWRRWRTGNENKQKTATLECRLLCDGHIDVGRSVCWGDRFMWCSWLRCGLRRAQSIIE